VSIRSARLEQMTNKFVGEILKLGRLPTPFETRRKFNAWLQIARPDQPRMQLRLQEYRSKFDREGFNASTEELIEDLNILYSESVSTVVRLLDILNADDIRHKALAYQVSVIDDLLEELLLNESGATGFSFSAYESFNDLSKIDSATTADVDLETGSVRLPTLGGLKKMNLFFLADRVRANPMVDDGAETKLVAGTRFGYLFDDIVGNCWIAEVTSDNDPVTAEFSIPIALHDPQTPLATAESQSAEVSRIDIDPHFCGPCQLDVLTSIDGVNWTRPPGYTQPTLAEGKRISLSFPKTLIKFLKFRMSKNADSFDVVKGARRNKAVFGLKNISLYQTGHTQAAELVTKALDIHGPSDGMIRRIALDVDERVPFGTGIDYFVSYGTAIYEWQKISPGTRDADAPRVIELQSSLRSPRRDNHYRVQATPGVNSTRNGITFYNAFAAARTPLARSTRLYRGINSWKRKVNTKIVSRAVRNNYVVFTLTDAEQSLYLEVEDEEIQASAITIAPASTAFEVAHEMLVDPSVPLYAEGRDVPRESPAYSVRRLIRILSAAVSGAGPTVATVAQNYDLREATITFPAMAALTGMISKGDYIYLNQTSGEYYKVLSVADAVQQVVVSDPDKVLLDGNADWSVGYEDITSSIEAINQRVVTLSAGQAFLAGDQLLISYRRTLSEEHDLVTSSVTVKGSTNEGETYQAGRDYVVKPLSKSIARLPEGKLSGSADQVIVRVDFEYRIKEPQKDTYTTFLYVDSDEPKVIEIPATLNLREDERVYIDDGRRVHDVSEVTKFPPLPRGWRQVTIRSTPVLDSGGAHDAGSAIYRALVLDDVHGRPVFYPNTTYFTKQTAFPLPMTETNLFRLQTGVYKTDRTYFAVDGNNLVINWDPTTLPDTIYPVWDGAMLTLLTYEEFEFEYRWDPATPIDRTLYLKATFKRDPKADPGLTPELHSFNLKFS